MLLHCRFDLLTHFWIYRILLLGEDWQGKAECQSY
jgi:hypothetical protein